jgi:hypothetical protein
VPKILKQAGLKLLEELLSVKIHIVALATILLVYGKIEGSTWSSVVVSIALGRVLIESIVAHHSLKASNEPTKPENSSDL